LKGFARWHRIRLPVSAMSNGTTTSKPHFSIPAILAVIAAILSFYFGATLGIILAVIAIILGVIGFLLAFLPGTRGGIVSVICIVCGLIGIIAAIVKLAQGNF
jgi:hypothetical protein